MLTIEEFEKSHLYLGGAIDIEYKGYSDFYLKDQIKKINYEKKSYFNLDRNKKTQKIKITLENNITLDGDEKSQERISRAINALDPEETTYWIDASGEPQELTREDLKEALKLAGQKQTEIFVEYAQKKADLMTA